MEHLTATATTTATAPAVDVDVAGDPFQDRFDQRREPGLHAGGERFHDRLAFGNEEFAVLLYRAFQARDLPAKPGHPPGDVVPLVFETVPQTVDDLLADVEQDRAGVAEVADDAGRETEVERGNIDELGEDPAEQSGDELLADVHQRLASVADVLDDACDQPTEPGQHRTDSGFDTVTDLAGQLGEEPHQRRDQIGGDPFDVVPVLDDPAGDRPVQEQVRDEINRDGDGVFDGVPHRVGNVLDRFPRLRQRRQDLVTVEENQHTDRDNRGGDSNERVREKRSVHGENGGLNCGERRSQRPQTHHQRPDRGERPTNDPAELAERTQRTDDAVLECGELVAQPGGVLGRLVDGVGTVFHRRQHVLDCELSILDGVGEVRSGTLAEQFDRQPGRF